MFDKSPKTGPSAEARANAAAMAKIIGGAVKVAGRRCMVQIGLSKKLANIDGAVECRDAAVTLSLVDISAAEVGTMLEALVLTRGKSKKRKAKR
jgi:hypothetical protein